MIFFALALKPIAWVVAFRFGTRGDMTAMMMWSTVIAVLLTIVDKICVADNLAASAIMLTLVLYVLMSFILIPLAWKVRKAAFSVVLNLVGILGAFAGVNFTMDLLRGLLPSMHH
jgi:hypothetical protein